ncbi:MAG: ribosome silencing factor [Bacteroidales bacterium]|nr:ribosome silencing factor [Bacteroidales bacterium]
MKETKELVKKVIEGIQEKKGNNITVVDMTKIKDAMCNYFVICQGGSNTHVAAIADSVVEHVKKNLGEKPLAQDGRTNMEWVAIDHGAVMTHVFVPQSRIYYNLEQLWNDARITHIEDIF